MLLRSAPTSGTRRRPASDFTSSQAGKRERLSLPELNRELLGGYADPPAEVIEDQLDNGTVEAVEALTGRRNVCPRSGRRERC